MTHGFILGQLCRKWVFSGISVSDFRVCPDHLQVREAQFSSLRLPEQNFAKLINTIYNSNRKMSRKRKHKMI